MYIRADDIINLLSTAGAGYHDNNNCRLPTRDSRSLLMHRITARLIDRQHHTLSYT